MVTNAAIDLALVAFIGQKNLAVFNEFITQLNVHSDDKSIMVTDKPTTIKYLMESFKNPTKFKAVLKSLLSPGVVEKLETLEPILDNTANGIEQLNASVGHILPDDIVTTLTQHNQLNQVLAQMKDHEHMFTTMAEAIRRASPNVDAFLDALVDAAFFAETDYLKQMQVYSTFEIFE